MRKKILLIIGIQLVLLLFLYSSPAAAFDVIYPDSEVKKFAVGFELTIPYTYAISGTYNFDESLAAQLTLGIPADYLVFDTKYCGGLKLMYRFARSDSFNIYLYGLAGQFQVSQGSMSIKESLIGYSAGIGVEYTSQTMPDDMKNAFELGYLQIPDTTDSSFSLFLAYGLRIYF